MKNIKTKVISISIAVLMLLSMAAVSLTVANAAEVADTTDTTDTTVTTTVPATVLISATVDSATPDSSSDSANGAIPTGDSAWWIASAVTVIAAAGVLCFASVRRKETH